MDAEQVEVRGCAGLVHRHQERLVRHGQRRAVAGRGQAGADDQSAWIALLDGGIAPLEHRHIFGRVGGLASPFTGQVRFVPHLIGRHFASVAACDYAAKVKEVGQVARRAGGDPGIQRIIAAIPVWLAVQPDDQVTGEDLGDQEDHLVGPAPVVFTWLDLDVAPGEGLLDPGEAGFADEAQVARGDLWFPPQIGLEAIARGFDAARRRRGRGRPCCLMRGRTRRDAGRDQPAQQALCEAHVAMRV